MEPERKIEKLLRAYAKKRRAESGEPLQMHPVTRRLLQDEVVRRLPQPQDEESLSLWQLWRQQWAFLCGFALIIFCLATLLLPALSAAKRKAQSVSAMNNLKQIGAAAQMAAAEANGQLPTSLDGLTNQLGSANVLIDPQSGKPFVYPAAGRNLDSLQPTGVLAYSPEGKKGRAVLLADGSVEYASPKQFQTLTHASGVELVVEKQNVPKQTPAAADREVASFKDTASLTQQAGEAEKELAPATPIPALPSKTDSIQFGNQAAQPSGRSQSTAVRSLFSNTAISARTAAVLVNFQMEQSGEILRVVDRDGSVYEGSWQFTNAFAQNVRGQIQSDLTGNRTSQSDAQRLNSANELQVIGQNYSFHVAGTNLTLKRTVVFNGNITVISGTTTPAQNIVGGKVAGQPFMWSNARITGTAIVAETNQIEINAAPQ